MNVLNTYAPGIPEVVSLITPSNITTIEAHSMRDRVTSDVVVIPPSVTTIEQFAFRGCQTMKSLTIPPSVTEIGAFAFSGCSSLVSVRILASVTEIKNGTFQRCSSLISVQIPASVTYIGNHAFYNCSSLSSVEIPRAVTAIGNNAFGKCSVHLRYLGSNTQVGNLTFAHNLGERTPLIGNINQDEVAKKNCIRNFLPLVFILLWFLFICIHSVWARVQYSILVRNADLAKADGGLLVSTQCLVNVPTVDFTTIRIVQTLHENFRSFDAIDKYNNIIVSSKTMANCKAIGWGYEKALHSKNCNTFDVYVQGLADTKLERLFRFQRNTDLESSLYKYDYSTDMKNDQTLTKVGDYNSKTMTFFSTKITWENEGENKYSPNLSCQTNNGINWIFFLDDVVIGSLKNTGFLNLDFYNSELQVTKGVDITLLIITSFLLIIEETLQNADKQFD